MKDCANEMILAWMPLPEPYTAKREGCDYHPSVVKNDITRLRRELNDVRRGMEWN